MPAPSIHPWIPPMKAIPTDRVPRDGTWAAELKWDGMRLQACTDGSSVVLRSLSGRDVTSSFPELSDLGAILGTSAVLDGEVVVFAEDRPSFRHLQQRIHVADPSQRLLAEVPAVYIAFDLLSLDGNSLVGLPYEDRRRLLADLLPQSARWQRPPHLLGGGVEMLSIATERGLEGIVLKRSRSTYQAGERSGDWLKLKIRLHQEFVVGGWLEGSGSLQDQIGSLMVGVWEGEELVLAGRVGSGISDAERRHLAGKLRIRSSSPFRAVPRLDRRPTWVEPALVVEVGFNEWPLDGHLRHPTYLGIRPDTAAAGVVRELGSSDG